MLKEKELRAAMAQRGCTPEKAAEALGLSAKAFEDKLKTGSLGLDEANRLVALLRIAKPGHIFFGVE